MVITSIFFEQFEVLMELCCFPKEEGQICVILLILCYLLVIAIKFSSHLLVFVVRFNSWEY